MDESLYSIKLRSGSSVGKALTHGAMGRRVDPSRWTH